MASAAPSPPGIGTDHPVSHGGRLRAAFVAALLILGAVIGLAYLEIRELAASYEELRAAQQTIEALGSVVGYTADAETGRRGYVLTRDERLLEAYHRGVEQLPHELRRLRALLPDDPANRRLLALLERRLAVKQQQLERSVAAFRSRPDDLAAQAAFTLRGKAVMDDVRGLVATLRRGESARVARHAARARGNLRRTVAAGAAGGLVSCLLFVATYVALTRENARSRRQEALIERLNQDLRRNLGELETANRELEGFSYSVSHDLRAPLRAIGGFARILEEDSAEKLDDEGRRLLGVVRDNARRMGRLIDDLLAFSRLTRKGLERAPVDMSALARQLAAELTAGGAHGAATVEVEALPPARADRALVQQVLSNLLGNALKFSRQRPEPRVEVSGWLADGDAVYRVRDNGTGFDMRYADKLFGVFQRLHKHDEFEGTGIGLALVQRIVHRHGGRVWAESAPGEGATFYFTLPVEETV